MVMEQRSGVSLRETRQILSEEMGDIDAVSRGRITDLAFLTPETRFDISSWQIVPDLLAACNPFVTQNLDDMYETFVHVAELLASVDPAPLNKGSTHGI